jgi:hypothetical protein
VAGTDDFCTACKDHGYRGRLEVEPGHYLLGSRLQHWSADDWKSRQEKLLQIPLAAAQGEYRARPEKSLDAYSRPASFCCPSL